ncbi:MAG TPA: aldo/keto reductase [Bacteroidales bacterium]|nr:aldo/keto reductase [Bacteroidales bacterium]
MKTNKLGDSGVFVTELAFGSWAIGGWQWGGADSKEAIRAIDASVNSGMTTIDTAPVYGFGLSEELVGKAIKGKRHNVQLLTKFGMVWDEKKGEYFFSSKDNNNNSVDLYKYSSKERIIKDCEKSLKRLGTDYIDLFQAHWPDSTTPITETMEALQVLIKAGKIRAGAVSNYSADMMRESIKTYHIASNQLPYSMLNRGIENEIVPFCLQNQVGIIAYSPLQRGILAGKISKDHKFNDGDSRPSTIYYKEPNLSAVLKFIDDLKQIANNRKVTLSQLVLNWTMRQPGITCTLTGIRTTEQALDNIKATEFSLSDDEIAEINNLISHLKIVTDI